MTINKGEIKQVRELIRLANEDLSDYLHALLSDQITIDSLQEHLSEKRDVFLVRRAKQSEHDRMMNLICTMCQTEMRKREIEGGEAAKATRADVEDSSGIRPNQATGAALKPSGGNP